MKKKLLITLLAFLGLIFGAAAQSIPNGDMETWINQGTYDDAQFWASLNSYSSLGAPITLSKSSNAHGGSFAARLETKSFFNPLITALDTAPGIMIKAGDFLAGPYGMAYAFRPDSLKAYYIYTPIGGDSAAIVIQLTKWNTSTSSQDLIADGEILIPAAAANYTLGSVGLNYYLSGNPDTAFIFITSGSGIVNHPGSVLIVDDVSLVVPVGIDEAENNSVRVTMFPNPASDKIRFSISPGNVTLLTVYDVSGHVLQSYNVAGKNFLDVSVSNYAAGLYLFSAQGKDGKEKANGKFNVIK